MSAFFGQQIKAADMAQAFGEVPGSNLVRATLMQMAKVEGFAALFGPYEHGKDQQRWADYQRFDWSVRQLPTINLFESSVEDKSSDQGFLSGQVQMQVFWPPSFRRSDLARVPQAFKGAVELFFSSALVREMLDEIYFNQRPMKVWGLNEYGKQLNWSPLTEGVVEDQAVPVTMLDVRYRIDLRAYYRALEFVGRTANQPFVDTLKDLATIAGTVDGVQGAEAAPVAVALVDKIEVTNP